MLRNFKLEYNMCEEEKGLPNYLDQVGEELVRSREIQEEIQRRESDGINQRRLPPVQQGSRLSSGHLD